jgi:hypothetical protein
MHQIPIDTSIPMADYPPTYEDLRDRINAMSETLEWLGDDVLVSDADIEQAHAVLGRGEQAPRGAQGDSLVASPGVVVHIKAILSEYDHQVVQSAVQIRNYVTNRLLLEAESAPPAQRMRALELLGKISDVGLFTDKSEVTMQHRPTPELEQILHERLHELLARTNAVEVQVRDADDAAITSD